MISYYEPKLDITLLGCGFLGSYHLGALYLLAKIWPQRPFERISGASCGGLIGVMLTAGVSIQQVLKSLRRVPLFFETGNLCGLSFSLSNTMAVVERELERQLPDEAHELCRNRCGISLTQLWPLENKFICNFESRRELVEAVLAGSFIPMCMGNRFPQFRNKRFMDGAYSDNAPQFELSCRDKSLGYRRRLRLSPFSSRELEVAPKDRESLSWGSLRILGTKYLLNRKNLKRALYALSLLRADYERNFRCGFDNMKNYLLAEEQQLIRCWQCNYQNFKLSSCLNCLKLLERLDSLGVSRKLFE